MLVLTELLKFYTNRFFLQSRPKDPKHFGTFVKESCQDWPLTMLNFTSRLVSTVTGHKCQLLDYRWWRRKFRIVGHWNSSTDTWLCFISEPKCILWHFASYRYSVLRSTNWEHVHCILLQDDFRRQRNHKTCTVWWLWEGVGSNQ
jgi:hypothetical protein